MRAGAAALAMLSLLAPCRAPARDPAPARIVLGVEKATYRITHPSDVSFLRSYGNDGFRQEVTLLSPVEARVEVEVRSHPSGASASFRAPDPGENPGELALVSRGETEGAATAWIASARLLSLAGRAVAHREERDVAWDADTVWRRGEGSCVGRANLALTLLGTVGIESRSARGLRFTGEPGETRRIGPALLHRWVEVRDPDVGWVFSDPAVSLHHVSARYIHVSAGGREGPEVDRALSGTRVTLLRLEGGLAAVDVEPGVEGGLPIRPAGAERYAGALIGRAPVGARVTLTGPAGARVERAGPGGRYAFLGLEPGIYRLEGAGRTEGFLLGARELRRAGERTHRGR